MAFLVSFLAKALSNTGYFCYQSMASAGIVMVSLPRSLFSPWPKY
jgi:hypothetical protein